ncbi:MAG TPA: hypothetical protein VJ743_20155 [Albitalea sp.]|nr:hypothetical protein [Albitalea sp.]
MQRWCLQALAAIAWIVAAANAPAADSGQHMHHGSGIPAKARAAPLAIGAAFSPNGVLWVVSVDAAGRLATQTSRDEGRHWDAARVLAIGGDTVSADGENRPKIAFGRRGQVVITYTRPLAQPYTGEIRLLRSIDGGRHFFGPVTVHRDRQVITHRFESVAFDEHGRLHVFWIDKRDLEAHKQSAAAEGVEPSYRGAAVYRSESSDGGASFGPDIRVAEHSCECCRLALATAPGGGLAAMWRHVFEPNERDHAFMLIGGTALAGGEPVRATYDRWALDGCPHHGPGLAADAQGGYHAVWFGEREGQARVRYGRLAADGTPVGEPVALPDERAEHADVQSAGPHVAIVWRSFDGQETQWRAWVSHDHGAHFALRELGHSADDNDHPRLAVRGQRIVALWRTTKGVQVERLTP